ncbi:5-formyltetrahydrofolate cyclo-ligase, partial [Nocardioides sp. P5_C9_2]
MPKPPEPPSEDLAGAKAALRRRLLEGRRSRPPAELVATAEAIAAHALAWDPVRRARTVAAYVAVGSEPGTGLLLEGLRSTGHRVLLPVVLPDLDLDWA